MAKRRRRIDSEVYREIHRRVREGSVTNASQLWREISDQFPYSPVSERTVRDIVRELEPPDPAGGWQPGPPNDPEDDAKVLKVVAATLPRWVTERGWQQHPERLKWRAPTVDEARWIAWICTGWPDLAEDRYFRWFIRGLAGDYRAQRASGRPTVALDALLGFAPWRSKEAYQAYEAALRQKQIPEPSIWWVFSAFIDEVKTREAEILETEEANSDAEQAERP